MSEPSETRRLWLIAVLGAWLLAFGWSFYAYLATGPDGSGFTRGANRVMAFLGWQIVAGLLGGVALVLSRSWPKSSGVRRVASVPFWLFGALLAVVVTTLSVGVIRSG